VEQRRTKRRPKKSAGPALVKKQELHPLGRVLDISSRFEGGDLNRFLRPVAEGPRIEHENFRVRSFVETLAALFTDPAAFDERLQDSRERDPEICRDVRNDVVSDNVHRSEGGALGPAQRRPCQGVDFLDRVVARLERLQDLNDRVDADVVGDEVRLVLRNHDAFAEAQVREAGHALNDQRIGLRRGNDFEKAQIPGWIEEVRAEPVAAKAVAPAFREHGDRNA